MTAAERGTAPLGGCRPALLEIRLPPVDKVGDPERAAIDPLAPF
jgi:hypothetical protein